MAALKSKKRAINLLLFIGAILFALVLSELILRGLNLDKPASGFPWKPYRNTVLRPNPAMLPGVSGLKHFTTNATGIRADEFSEEQTYSILAVGGSTTECLYLDDSEAWPRLTQASLNANGYSVWVGNAGRSGARLISYIDAAKRLVSSHPQIDALVVLSGINDLVASLRLTLEGPPSQRTAQHEGVPLPLSIKTTELWKLLRKAYQQLSGRQKELVQDNAGQIYETWRQNRRRAIKETALPDLSSALTRYKSELNQFIDFSESKKLRIIFMTQPTIWRADLSDEERRFLWYGFGGESKLTSTKYYAVTALERAMEMFNTALLSTCESRGIEYIDLATMLPKDFTTFYDDCHFNKQGAAKIAALLSAYLIKQTTRGLPLSKP